MYGHDISDWQPELIQARAKERQEALKREFHSSRGEARRRFSKPILYVALMLILLLLVIAAFVVSRGLLF